MSLEVQIAHRLDEIGPEAWDALGSDRPFASYRWYRYGEAVLSDDVPVYVVVWQGETPVARAAFWLRRNEPVPISSRGVRGLVGAIMRRWPLLICQAPLADAAGLILPEPPLRDEALAAIGHAALAQARRHGASFALCTYLGPQAAGLVGWPAAFVAGELPEPGTSLSLAWPDFDTYIGSLSRSARKDYRRHGNRAADLGIEVVTRPGVEDVERALALFRNVEGRHDAAPDPWARAALGNAHLVDATWLTAEVEGQIVGSGLLLRDGEVGQLKYLGLDYEVQYAYFQLVYAALQAAIESDLRVLVGGAGAYEMKQRLGFELVDTNYVVFAGRGPLLGRLGRRLVSAEEAKVQDPYAA